MNRRVPSFPAALLVFVLAAAGLVHGCLPTATPPTRFYALSAAPADAGSPDFGIGRFPSVEVVPVRVPQYLDRPQIVTRSGPHRLELAEFDQWAGNLRKNMTRVIVENLSVRLRTADVRIAPSRAAVPADVRVEVEVLQFERCEDRRVRLGAQWVLTVRNDPSSAAVRITRLQSRRLPGAPDYTSTVSAMSDLLAELSEAIARAVTRSLAKGPGA